MLQSARLRQLIEMLGLDQKKVHTVLAHIEDALLANRRLIVTVSPRASEYFECGFGIEMRAAVRKQET